MARTYLGIDTGAGRSAACNTCTIYPGHLVPTKVRGQEASKTCTGPQWLNVLVQVGMRERNMVTWHNIAGNWCRGGRRAAETAAQKGSSRSADGPYSIA
jgi:hypothetical protein